jgi:hypothetical protein
MSVRKTSLVVVLGVLALAAVLVLSNGVLPAAAAPAKQVAASAPSLPRTITVVGTGEVKRSRTWRTPRSV